MKKFLPNLAPLTSTIHSGFHDGSGLVEVPALLLGGIVAATAVRRSRKVECRWKKTEAFAR
ncbi:MAG: hypothetical protein R3D29_08380 [Nitratireductor sp.]